VAASLVVAPGNRASEEYSSGGTANAVRVMFNICEAISDLVEQRLCEAFETGHRINVSGLVSEIA
jgi:hypothetical protein